MMTKKWDGRSFGRGSTEHVEEAVGVPERVTQWLNRSRGHGGYASRTNMLCAMRAPWDLAWEAIARRNSV
jgi:hypothetical protein